MKDADIQALEALIIDNPDLKKLESLLEQFNIFEAIGAVRQELRHSDFLAFLLNPNQNHGLGDEFAKRLLQQAIWNAPREDLPFTPIDLDVWNLDDLEVRREWNNIDILLLDGSHKLAVVIENKVKGTEHSGQLKRYQQIVRQGFPDHKILSLYLTPEGEEPSDESYLPISYDLVCELVENLVQSRRSTLGPDVRTLLIHYAQMLRRNIMIESEIAKLCRRIYRKHQHALDLIFEHRPDIQSELRSFLLSLIQGTKGLVLVHSTKTVVLFILVDWNVPALKGGKGWVPEGNVLLFQFVNAQDSLKLRLVIGPGKPEFSRRLFREVQKIEASTPLKTHYKNPQAKWNTIYQRHILNKRHYENADAESRQEEIRKKWTQFLEKDLPIIKEFIKSQEWIWEGEL